MRSEVPFFLLKGDTQTSPFTFSQLCSMWNHGVITADTLYRQEGDAEWLSTPALLDVGEQTSTRALSPTISATATLTPPPLPVSQRKCLFCGEPIAEMAMKCRHCGEILNPRLRAAEEANKAAARVPAAPVFQPQNNVFVNNAAPLRPFPHFLHGVFTVLTLGLWFPVWLLHYLFRNRRYYY